MVSEGEKKEWCDGDSGRVGKCGVKLRGKAFEGRCDAGTKNWIRESMFRDWTKARMFITEKQQSEEARRKWGLLASYSKELGQ